MPEANLALNLNHVSLDPKRAEWSFVGGAEYRRSDGEVARFADTAWPVEDHAGGSIVLHFDALPAWAVRGAKIYLAGEWLKRSLKVRSLSGQLSALRRGFRLIDVEGVEDITRIETTEVSKRLRQMWLAREAALDEISLREGREPNVSEKRALDRERGVLGPGTVRQTVNALNGWRAAVRVDGGIDLPEFDIPPDLPTQGGMVGGANPEKVIDVELQAALQKALQQDVEAYESARARIDEAFSGVDFSALTYDGERERLRIYFGLGGALEHTIVEIADQFGIDSSNVTRALQAALKSLGMDHEEQAALMALRHEIPAPLLSSRVEGTLEAVAEARQAVEGAKWEEAGLSPSERACLVPLLGLDGAPPIGVTGIAESLTLSGPLVSKYLGRAFRRLFQGEDLKRIQRVTKALRRVRAEDWVEVSHRRARIRDILDKYDLAALEPDENASTAVKLYMGLDGARPCSGLEVNEKGLVGSSPLTTLRRACRELLGKEAKEIARIRKRLPYLYLRAIKACALQLQLCLARRIGELLEMKEDVDIRVEMIRSQPVTFIEYTTKKMSGSGTTDIVQAPGMYGEMAAGAIEKVRELTGLIRKEAPDDVRDQLFISPSNPKSFRGPTALTESNIGTYFRTDIDDYDTPLVDRLDLDALLGRELSSEEAAGYKSALRGFTPHWMRHTHATTIFSAGGMPKTVAHYLGHNDGGAMGLKFYVSGSTPQARARYAEQVERGAVRGQVVDSVTTLFHKLKGSDRPAPEHLQMSIDEAMRRLETTHVRELVDSWSPESLVDYFETYGVGVKLGRQGGCTFGAEWNTCPAPGTDCSVGVDVERSREDPGCGCRYQAWTTLQVEVMEEDVYLLDQTIDLAEERGHEALAETYRQQRQVKLVQIKMARDLDEED